MRDNIEKFLDDMTEKLNSDMIKYIISTYIYGEKNKRQIIRQKKLKKLCNLELIKFFSILYFDNNFIVYRNVNGEVILENNHIQHANMYLFSNINNNVPSLQQSIHVPQNYQQIADNIFNTSNVMTSTLTHTEDSSNDTNDIVLISNTTNNQILDENGIIRQRRIHLSIVYV